MTLSRPYLIPLSEVRREIVVVNSRFIATLAPVFSIEEARTFLARIRHEFADATHNVPVYIIGGGNTVTEYFSDDGEPAGTAGRPALAVLRGQKLGDAGLVITRYFGGTKLGTGGLVKAYTQSAQSVVDAAGRGIRVRMHVAMLAIPYHLLERVRLAVARHKVEILSEDFAADITITMQIPVDVFDVFQTTMNELSAGKAKVEMIETMEKIVRVG